MEDGKSCKLLTLDEIEKCCRRHGEAKQLITRIKGTDMLEN